MTVFVVLALLASNIFLAKMLLLKDKEKADSHSTAAASDNTPDPPKNNNEGVSDASVENPIEEKIASVVGESKYDPDTYKQIVKEIVKEVVPLIIEEYGNFADAGFPELEDKKSSIVVPNDKLDEVFSNTTVAELTGEAPEPTEPCADGLDFNDMTTTMNVLKETSDNPEDMEVAQETLRKLDGTFIKEKLSLDPAIQKKILLIELHLPKQTKEETEDTIPEHDQNDSAQSPESQPDKPKRVLFHADIDTSDIDEIDFNVYH